MHRIFSLVCGLYGTLESVTVLRWLRNCRDIIIIIIIFLNPRKTRVGKKLKKLRKNEEDNVPSGCPTQNYCATKQN